jgi:hypothetical protein
MPISISISISNGASPNLGFVHNRISIFQRRKPSPIMAAGS